MAAAFSEKTTAMGFEVSYEIDALQARLGRQEEALSDDVGSSEVFLDQGATGLENQLDCLAEVETRFLKRIALGVGAWQLLHESDVAAIRIFPEHRRQFECHRTSLRYT